MASLIRRTRSFSTSKLPPVGDMVDLSIPSWTKTIGAAEPGAVWTDPDFDPALRAFYYARVIEIPTPRWTASTTGSGSTSTCRPRFP